MTVVYDEWLPPRRLMVLAPWQVDTMRACGYDIDAAARRAGFDGFVEHSTLIEAVSRRSMIDGDVWLSLGGLRVTLDEVERRPEPVPAAVTRECPICGVDITSTCG